MRSGIAIAVVAAAACSRSSSPSVVAVLELVESQVDRMPSADAPWQPARVGDTFVIDSAVRTGAASRAKLRVGGSGKLDVNPNTIVRFTRKPGRDRHEVEVDTGSVELETGETVIGLGAAVLDPRTRARVERTSAGVRIDIALGRAVLEDQVLAAGQSITLTTDGKRVVTPGDVAPRPAPPTNALAITVTGAPVTVTVDGRTNTLAPGTHPIEPGSAVTVPADSSVAITRDGARATASGPSSLRIGGKDSLVELASGTVALDGDAPAVARVRGGSVTSPARGETTVTIVDGAAAIDARRGDTTVTAKRETVTLAQGESAVLTAGGALERIAPPPERTVATIAAGESPVLHDPRAPTPVRVRFDTACSAPGTVEVARDRSFSRVIARASGVGGANVLVPAGTVFYRVRCAPGRGERGTIRVVRDSGKTPLPKAAARTLVEMDGREYTILFQNLMPEITLSWRDAPRKASYTFVVAPRSGAAKRIASREPKLALPTGTLREGQYTVWVEPEGGGRSEDSRIVIDFDNAAPSASIDAVDSAAAAVRVKGTVIEGSSVSAGGAAVELDRHRRFTTTIPIGDDEDGVSVRIAHDKLGIHYYVMRKTAP